MTSAQVARLVELHTRCSEKWDGYNLEVVVATDRAGEIERCSRSSPRGATPDGVKQRSLVSGLN